MEAELTTTIADGHVLSKDQVQVSSERFTKRFPWREIVFHGRNPNNKPSNKIGMRKKMKIEDVNLKQLLTDKYAEYVIEMSLDDIVIEVDEEEIDEEKLNKVAELLSEGYKITTGYIAVTIAGANIPFNLDVGVIKKLRKSNKTNGLARIVDGLYRVIVLKVLLKRRLISTDTVIVCLVVRKDGRALDRDEMFTYSARKQVLNNGRAKKELVSIIKACNLVVTFLYNHCPDVKYQSLLWFQKQMKCILVESDGNIQSLRKYVMVSKNCVGDSSKTAVIERLLSVYPEIGIGHIAQEYLLRRPSRVIELYFHCIAKAINPVHKRTSNESEHNRCKRKRTDKRNKMRRIPAVTKFLKSFVDDIVMFFDTADQIVSCFTNVELEEYETIYTSIFACENKNFNYSLMEIVADRMCEWIFERQSLDMYFVMKAFILSFVRIYNAKLLQRKESEYKELVLEVKERDVLEQDNNRKEIKKNCNQFIDSRNSGTSNEHDEETEGRKNDSAQRRINDVRSSPICSTSKGKKGMENADEGKVKKKVAHENIDKFKSSATNSNIEEDRLLASSNVGEPAIANHATEDSENSNIPICEERASIRIEMIPRDSVALQIISLHGINIESDNSRNVLFQPAEKKRIEGSADIKTIHNVNSDDSANSKHVECERSHEGKQSYSDESDGEPSMDRSTVPSKRPRKSLSSADRRRLDGIVDTVHIEHGLKLGYHQSLWSRKDFKTMKLRQWLKCMFIPSNHRINHICTFDTISVMHSQIFSLAAECYRSTLNDVHKEMSHETVNCEPIHGSIYFDTAAIELHEKGWTIMKGIFEDKVVRTNGVHMQSILSFNTVEDFVETMPLMDGQNHLWEQIVNEDYDDIENQSNSDRRITSTHAVMEYMEREECVWKRRAFVDMAIGMILSILKVGNYRNGCPDMYMLNTGGKFILTGPGTKRQQLHCDNEVHLKSSTAYSQQPGYSAMVSCKEGFWIWILDNSHVFLHEPKESYSDKTLRCRKVWVKPYSLLIFRGDLGHAGGPYMKTMIHGSIRYHVRFIPVAQEFSSSVHFLDVENVIYDL